MKILVDADLAETIPDGTFGHSRPTRRQPSPRHWTTEEQDAHWQALCASVGTPDAQRPTRHENAAQNAA
ncbi:hypothetical protein DV517_61850 [Streptomyces sp. S816]|uniref:hypothetical protein n=1 Tax=Streptomyces sp. S816 TaxID=2283197 RepID=UPI00109C5B42|nr:hypothetical protein [Streptomyces sp. S816]TGZ14702.1 hypothetical protein DV517_61850 [Streptomyces sp. S816]